MKLIVDIPSELHQKLKIKAIKEKTTMKNLITPVLKKLTE